MDNGRGTGIRDLISGFYGIVNVAPGWAEPVEAARSMLAGGCRVIQLRYKSAGRGDFLRLAVRIKRMAGTYGALFVVNDDLPVAVESGAGGFQTGQSDIPCSEARKVLGPGVIIGVSAHNLAQLERAQAEGADYAGFGPVFSTSTKENPDPATGVAGLRDAVKAARIPVVAIGGITLESAPEVVGTGVSALASIDAVYRSGDIESAVRRLNSLFEKRTARLPGDH